jgi:hypothetical protein
MDVVHLKMLQTSLDATIEEYLDALKGSGGHGEAHISLQRGISNIAGRIQDLATDQASKVHLLSLQVNSPLPEREPCTELKDLELY